MAAADVDLTNCDREPIHTPGSIQPHGCLLACARDGSLVLRYSDNAIEMLGLTANPIGTSLTDCFGAKFAHDVLNAAAKSAEPRRPGLLRSVRLTRDALFDVAVHTFKGTLIVEFEPASDRSIEDPLEIVRALIARSQSFTDISSLCRRIPRYLQALLGYDRVMIYQFAPDGSGKVIGEAKQSDLESFLGQHFPAADIPTQARILYLHNTIRIIANADGSKSSLTPRLDLSGEPLDLSFAHLRSVSPIHLEYLRNMGVAASMSVSVIVDGALWGLIACHHYAPKALTMAQRVGAEVFGEFFSLHLTALHHQQRVETTMRVRRALDELLAELSFHEDLDDFLRDALPEFASLIRCDGVGLWMNGIWTPHRSVPPSAFIPRLARLASEGDPRGATAMHAISHHIPEAHAFAGDAAGMLSVPLSSTPRDFLFFFRREKVQTLEWAGDPHKTYTSGLHGDRLTPRQSFAIWKQVVNGQSDPWTEDERNTGNALLIGLREVILRNAEVLASERKKGEVRQRILNDELNHRVKNILALIKSLVSHPVRPEINLDEFIKGLKGRILALSHAHDQVVRSDGGGRLHDLLRAELSPYPQQQIRILGNDIGLDARAYAVMALVLHELATNAAKYGALSTRTGTLTISTEEDAQGDCSITWVERDGPSVTQPERTGFGSVLLKRSVPFDLDGTSNVEYHLDGVRAHFTIPGRFLSALPHRIVDKPMPSAAAAALQASLQDASVLLLEDQLVIALDAEEMLKSAGISKVTTVSTAEEALRRIADGGLDFAILDVNLGSGNSLVVANELAGIGLPFVFATGYGDSVMIPESLRGTPMVRKPYTIEGLIAAMASVSKPTSDTPGSSR